MKEKDAHLALGRDELIVKMKEQFVVFHVSTHVELWSEGPIFFQLYMLNFYLYDIMTQLFSVSRLALT